MTFFGIYATGLGNAHAGMPAYPLDEAIAGTSGRPSGSQQTRWSRKPQLA